MRFGVAARSPVTVTAEGDLTYQTDGDDRWEPALQFARRRDAMAFIRLCKRVEMNDFGHALHVVELKG